MSFIRYKASSRDILWLTWFANTGCLKKGIEPDRARYCTLITLRMNEILRIRKDQAFSCSMICFSCQIDKKWGSTSSIKNVNQNHIFSPVRLIIAVQKEKQLVTNVSQLNWDLFLLNNIYVFGGNVLKWNSSTYVPSN